MKFTKGLTAVGLAGSLLGGLGAATVSSMSTAAAATATTMTVKSGISLNVRSGPGVNYAVKGSLPGGSVITGVNQSNGWVQIISGNYAGGWASVAYLVPSTIGATAPVTNSASTDDSTAFRGYISKTLIKTLTHTSPSTSSPIKRYLTAGTAVEGILVGDWLKTTNGDYVSRALITTAPLSNGNLPASRLCNIPVAWNSPGSWAPGYTPSTVRRLDCYALKSLTGLEDAYHAQFGRYARIDLGYRSFAEQQYWYQKFGYPRAAIPGTSNHGLGVAVDFRETDVAGEEFGWGGSGYTWLKNQGWKWGFRNTFAYDTAGESYHWDFEGVN